MNKRQAKKAKKMMHKKSVSKKVYLDEFDKIPGIDALMKLREVTLSKC